MRAKSHVGKIYSRQLISSASATSKKTASCNYFPLCPLGWLIRHSPTRASVALPSFLPSQRKLPPCLRTIQKVKVDQVLIGNPGLRGERFEVINDVRLKPNGHSLLETLRIWVPLGL